MAKQDMEEEKIKTEVPFSKKNEKEDGQFCSEEVKQQNGQRHSDNPSMQDDRELQERYRDGTSMQGDIKDQQQKWQRSEDGTDANQDEDLQKKYGHREEGPPPMNGEIEWKEGDDEQDSHEHQQFSN